MRYDGLGNLAMASAKLYHSDFSAKKENWNYTGLRGTLILGENEDRASSEPFWFRIYDETASKLLWVHKIPKDFKYCTERPFFHYFRGLSRMWGLLIEDEDESYAFSTIVHQIACPIVPAVSPAKTRTKTRNVRSTSPSSSVSSQSNSLKVSSPIITSFSHVSHAEIGTQGNVKLTTFHDMSSKASWDQMFVGLEARGSIKSNVMNNPDFVTGIVHGLSFMAKRRRAGQRE